MLGIWCVLLWQQLGQPGQLALVELGPGRGTLMADLLRGIAAFKPFAQALQVGGGVINYVIGYGIRFICCCGWFVGLADMLGRTAASECSR
jgi:hypothetical protein